MAYVTFMSNPAISVPGGSPRLVAYSLCVDVFLLPSPPPPPFPPFLFIFPSFLFYLFLPAVGQVDRRIAGEVRIAEVTLRRRLLAIGLRRRRRGRRAAPRRAGRARTAAAGVVRPHDVDVDVRRGLRQLHHHHHAHALRLQVFDGGNQPAVGRVPPRVPFIRPARACSSKYAADSTPNPPTLTGNVGHRHRG